MPYPLSVFVDTYGTIAEGHTTDSELTKVVNDNFDLRPGCIIRDRNLRRPIMRKTAAYGQFGREDPDIAWEAANKGRTLPGNCLSVLKQSLLAL